MDQPILLLLADNGSVPPAYFYSYEIIFRLGGRALFVLSKGIDEHEAPVLSESKTYDKQALTAVYEEIRRHQSPDISEAMVGGERKNITLIESNKPIKIDILPHDESGILLFEKCLRIYDPDFEEKLTRLVNN